MIVDYQVRAHPIHERYTYIVRADSLDGQDAAIAAVKKALQKDHQFIQVDGVDIYPYIADGVVDIDLTLKRSNGHEGETLVKDFFREELSS